MSRISRDEALRRLRALIEAEDLGPGARLPAERRLAPRLGCSRETLRAALDVLEAEGRIWRRQGAGTFIGAATRLTGAHQIARLPQMSNMFEVMEVRLRLEPALARLAAVRASAADVARMRALCDSVSRADDMDSRELWDGALHRAIAEAAGNTLFLAVFEVVDRVRQDDTWRHVREALRTHGTAELYTSQHSEVLDAIERRDPVAAERAMRRHLLSLQERLLLQSSEELANAE